MEEFEEEGQESEGSHNGPEPKAMKEPKGFDLPLWSKLTIAAALIFIATIGYSKRFFFKDPDVQPPVVENPDQGQIEDRGQPMDFSVVSADGKSVDVNSQRGKVTVVSFWASWCGPCMAELPTFGSLRSQIPSEDLSIWLVNLDEPGEAKNIVDRIWTADSFQFPKLFDPEKKAAEKTGVDTLPATLVLDKKGRVAMRGTGSNDWGSDKSVEMIQGLLSEKYADAH